MSTECELDRIAAELALEELESMGLQDRAVHIHMASDNDKITHGVEKMQRRSRLQLFFAQTGHDSVLLRNATQLAFEALSKKAAVKRQLRSPSWGEPKKKKIPSLFQLR